MHLHLDDSDFNQPERLIAAASLIVAALPNSEREGLYDHLRRIAPPINVSNLTAYRGEATIPGSAATRDHELHEAGPLVECLQIIEFNGVKLDPPIDLPPPGTFTQAELDANANPFAPAAGASTTNVSAVEPEPTSGSASALDTDGLPWDERIHSSNRKLASNGKWWAKRGVDDQTRLKVEAELRAVLGPITSVEGSVDPTRAPVPPPTPAPIAGTPPPPPPPPVRVEPPFPLFVKALNLHNNDKTKTRIETLTINEAIAAMGIAPAVLPTMAQQQHWSRLGELAQMLGLEGVA